MGQPPGNDNRKIGLPTARRSRATGGGRLRTVVAQERLAIGCAILESTFWPGATAREPVDQEVHDSLEPLNASIGLARKFERGEQFDGDQERLQVVTHLSRQQSALLASGHAFPIPCVLELTLLAHLHRAQVRSGIKVQVELASSSPGPRTGARE